MYGTRTTTQTGTQAKRLAARIGADLLQIHAAYGRPTQDAINDFMLEAEMYLSAGYVESIRYGFKRDGLVVFELVYTARDASGLDDKSGGVKLDADVQGASWFSYLKQNDAWWRLTSGQRDAFRASLPLERTPGDDPKSDPRIRATGSKQYSEESLGLNRETRAL